MSGSLELWQRTRRRGHARQPSLLDFAVFGHVLVVCGGSWVSKLDHGKMRGFPNYDEAVQLLDDWLRQYPGLFRKKEIGSTFQKRKIYAYVIRLHDKQPFKAPPQMLLTALMHAREPASLTVLLYFIGHLLELYQQGDPHACYIVQTREIWAIPFVNPDGYIANEKLRARDRRKNMRPTCGSTSKASSGVDINRNFGFHWSSQFPKCDEEYAGTRPFSEPETVALKQLIEQHHFVSAVNFHSFGGMLTHPYNYGRHSLPVDDQRIYDEIAKIFKWPRFGTALQTVGYTAPGESDDWMYAAHKIISMSPEVGPESGDFWPSSKLIAGIDERNFVRTLAVTQKTGFQLESSWTSSSLQEHKLPNDIRDGLKVAGGAASGVLVLRVRNTGMAASAGKALILAVSGATGPGKSPQKVSAFVHHLGDTATHFGTKLAGIGGHALALVFQTGSLQRRSETNFEILLARSVASSELVKGKAASDQLQLCVMEVPDQPVARAVCHCQQAKRLSAGVSTFVEAKSSGSQQERLCAAAAAFVPGEEQPAASTTEQPAASTTEQPAASTAQQPAAPDKQPAGSTTWAPAASSTSSSSSSAGSPGTELVHESQSHKPGDQAPEEKASSTSVFPMPASEPEQTSFASVSWQGDGKETNGAMSSVVIAGFIGVVSVLSLCLLTQLLACRRVRTIISVADVKRESASPSHSRSEDEAEALRPVGMASKV